MAAIDFPASPTVGQAFAAENGVVYTWNGTLWLASGASTGGDVNAYVSAGMGFGGTGTVVAVFDVVRTGNSGGWLNLSNGRYTPPAGRYYISAAAGISTASTTGSTLFIALRKNGTNVAQTGQTMSGSTGWSSEIQVDGMFDANGTDYFDVALNALVGSVFNTNAGYPAFTAFPVSGIKGPPGDATPGTLIQTVSYQTGASATGTTVIPQDDTIPQIGEGNEYMTLAITPRSATSKLIIEVIWTGSNSVTTSLIVALFQDATANALAANIHYQVTASGLVTIALRHTMTSGTTSATTFRVRAGGSSAGTTNFNGYGGIRLFGGVCASSIVIQEVAT